MFPRFASFISRHWIWVLVAWVVLAVGIFWIAPKWNEITHDGDFAYLPAKCTSVRGQKLLRETFPDLTAKSSIVLIVARDGEPLTTADKEVVAKLAEMFTPKEGEKSPVVSVRAYREDDVVGQKLISAFDPKNPQKGQAALVSLQLATEMMAVENMPFLKGLYAKVAEMQEQLQKSPDLAGLQLGVTGSAPVGTDLLDSMRESIEHTELTTIILVIAILLIVYRAPGLVLVPLVSIGVSYFVALGSIALVAQFSERHNWDFQVFTTTNIFIVVILFGAATDYCLFLIARFREELELGLEPREALEEALGQTGHALTASAMTTILGLGAMYFADFGKYRSGGPTIAMSLVVALAACMTVAPALLRAMGRMVFWPFGVSAPVKEATKGAAQVPAAPRRTMMGRLWNAIARQIVAHPGMILVVSFIVLAVPAWHGFNVPITYDMLAELDSKRESVQGMQLLEKHFLIGETGPIVLLANIPGGNFDTAPEWKQIALMAKELNDFQFANNGQTSSPIDHVRCLVNPLGDALTKKKMRLWTAEHLSGRDIGTRAGTLAQSRPFYLSSGEHLGEATRFELVTNLDPFSQESIDLVGAIDKWLGEKKAMPDSPWRDVEFDFTGTTAEIRDLDAVNRSDTFYVGWLQWHGWSLPWVGGISVYVTAAVLIVLLFLLRRPVVSVYLIFTVVFGYLVTLGLTQMFFSWHYGASYQGLDWKLKIFLFVILVAVGEDYNIYLVTRVFEEQRRRGPLEGLREAVARTGGIITSCGVIMAGTFGSMTTGTLRSMIELGFAMSLGVLLDTFIIRTILVPAFLALMARWGVDSTMVEARGDVAMSHYESAGSDRMRASKHATR